jgi:hypothetical protein
VPGKCHDFLSEMDRYADIYGTIVCQLRRFLLSILRRSIYYTTATLPLFSHEFGVSRNLPSGIFRKESEPSVGDVGIAALAEPISGLVIAVRSDPFSPEGVRHHWECSAPSSRPAL